MCYKRLLHVCIGMISEQTFSHNVDTRKVLNLNVFECEPLSLTCQQRLWDIIHICMVFHLEIKHKLKFKRILLTNYLYVFVNVLVITRVWKRFSRKCDIYNFDYASSCAWHKQAWKRKFWYKWDTFWLFCRSET